MYENYLNLRVLFIGETMGTIPEENQAPQINVRNVLLSKNKSLGRIIPSFLIKYLERIIHQEELNGFLYDSRNQKDYEFVDVGLKFLKTTYKAYGQENLPSSGRFIFVSNHPLGGLDGLVFINELSKYYDDIKFPVNDLLMNLRNMSGIFLPINKHGMLERSAAQGIEQAYASSGQILYFPAGLCSRKRKGVIKDLTWHKSFITKAVRYQRDIVPAYFAGRNSDFFYNFANLRTRLGIKANIEMLYLVDEMFRQRGKEIKLIFGKPIPWQTFDQSRTPSEWAEWVKSKSYELQSLLEIKQ
jgi:1-acyl-sn-glycerol-3-phosphate acyltransferase